MTALRVHDADNDSPDAGMSLSDTHTIMSDTFAGRWQGGLVRRFGTGKPAAYKLHKVTGYPQSTCGSWLAGVVPRGDVLEAVTDKLGVDFVVEVYRTQWARYLAMAAKTDRLKADMADIAQLHAEITTRGNRA